MSAVALGPEPAVDGRPACAPRGHGPTLEAVATAAWDALRAGEPTACLVCAAPLTPRHSAGAGIVGGRCEGCGSALG